MYPILPGLQHVSPGRFEEKVTQDSAQKLIANYSGVVACFYKPIPCHNTTGRWVTFCALITEKKTRNTNIFIFFLHKSKIVSASSVIWCITVQLVFFQTKRTRNTETHLPFHTQIKGYLDIFSNLVFTKSWSKMFSQNQSTRKRTIKIQTWFLGHFP